MDESVPLQRAAASTPVGSHIEPEPPEWQPKATWVGARLLTGCAAFFLISFVFAYFYLKSLDVGKRWVIGHYSPPIGWGVAIAAVLVVSAVLLRMAHLRHAQASTLALGALVLALVAVVLQCIEYTTLGFGPASGGYASVFVGWTVFQTVGILACAYWIEVQVATIWRRRREGAAWAELEEGPAFVGRPLLASNLEACSFFWGFYVFVAFAAFVILYLIGT